MNETVTGKIQDIKPRPVSTKAGPATVYDITIDGITISSFKPGNVSAGDTVEVEFYTNNGYRNAVNIKLVEPAKGQTALPNFGAGPTKFTYSDRIDIGMMMSIAESENTRMGKKEQLSSDEVLRLIALFKKVHDGLN